MTRKSSVKAALSVAAFSLLASCSALPYRMLPPAEIGSPDAAPVEPYGWSPYGTPVPQQMPERTVEPTPGWRSAAAAPTDVSKGELPPVDRPAPVDDQDAATAVPEPGDAVRSDTPATADGWGGYKPMQPHASATNRPYSSRPIPGKKSSSEKALAVPSSGGRVRIDQDWAKSYLPKSMIVEVNTMALQAVRTGSARWIGLDGRNFAAESEPGASQEACTDVSLTISRADGTVDAPTGHAIVCPR